MNRNSLLLVEDEPGVRCFIADGLEKSGYKVDAAADGAAGLGLACTREYSAIVLDVGLPGDMDGCAVAGELRARQVRTPIVMLTGMNAICDVVRGLDAGADDYLTKPFEFPELEARLRALIRRQEAVEGRVLQFGSLELDPVTRVVRRSGRSIRLTVTEFRLLLALMQNPERTLTRESLRQSIWGLDFDPGTRLVDVHMANLRKKLEAQGEPRLIATVRGVGFQLTDAGRE